ncbi:MAG: calcium/sodium antiporter [Geminicoccaceae bacterium]|nr:calcium/sodium antiporter [Geminicoccaceae bacterium]
MDMLYLAVGFVLLIGGGEALVRGSVTVARQAGLSPFVIGLTLVGFGTSTPELVTSIQAALVDAPGIAIGNVFGSNIANVLLILGAAAVLQPIACDPTALARDGTMMIAATAACIIVVLTVGAIDRITGGVFVLLFVCYLVATWLHDRAQPDATTALHAQEGEAVEPMRVGFLPALLLTLGGIALTVLGARLLVSGAIGIAQAFGVSQTVIGLTVVAIGTSLPELVTSVMAAMRRQADLALGNIIGSNIFNILSILGITALIQPIAVPEEVLGMDLWVLGGVSLLLVVFARTGWRLSRREGAVFLFGYVAYVIALWVRANGTV